MKLLLSALFFTFNVSLLSAPAFSQELSYGTKQYNTVAQEICSNIDRYKQEAGTGFPILPAMCVAVPKACKRGDKQLDMRGMIRVTIAQGFDITDSDYLERYLPALLSGVISHSCDTTSTYALPGVADHEQKRNILKRAIFTDQTGEMFNRHLFRDYPYNSHTGKRLLININAVEFVDGEPETLLDYLDKILMPESNVQLSETQRNSFNSLRAAITHVFGAVNARNLD